MKNAVLYTGTFDPFHLGHLWQLERTYQARPFDKAVVALIKTNPKKPNATSWQDRIKLVRLMIDEHNLPFPVEIRTIDYVQPDRLKEFTTKHLDGYRVIRTVASDVVVEFARDSEFGFNDALLLFHYAVVVRPLVGQKEVEETIAKLPLEVAKKFSYEIIHVQVEDDISATNIRKDPTSAHTKNYITKAQLDLIKREHLYL